MKRLVRRKTILICISLLITSALLIGSVKALGYWHPCYYRVSKIFNVLTSVDEFGVPYFTYLTPECESTIDPDFAQLPYWGNSGGNNWTYRVALTQGATGHMERFAHFGTPFMVAFLQRLAQRVGPGHGTSFAGNAVLTINDMSLWKGGEFINPITGRFEHSGHTSGLAADIWLMTLYSNPSELDRDDVYSPILAGQYAPYYDPDVVDSFVAVIREVAAQLMREQKLTYSVRIIMTPPAGYVQPQYTEYGGAEHEDHWHVEFQ